MKTCEELLRFWMRTAAADRSSSGGIAGREQRVLRKYTIATNIEIQDNIKT